MPNYRRRTSLGVYATLSNNSMQRTALRAAADERQAAGGGVVDIHIRDATETDLADIVDIYNQSIPAGWSTADTKPITVADRVEWFSKFDPAKRPIWVAEIDGRV